MRPPTEAPAATPVNKPGADAVRDTWDYFYKGQGQGPVLVEAKLCTEVGKDGANKYECTAEVDPAAGVKANTPNLVLWQAYLVPQGDSIEDIMVQTSRAPPCARRRTSRSRARAGAPASGPVCA